jgi:hypothetical protein
METFGASRTRPEEQKPKKKKYSFKILKLYFKKRINPTTNKYTFIPFLITDTLIQNPPNENLEKKNKKIKKKIKI